MTDSSMLVIVAAVPSDSTSYGRGGSYDSPSAPGNGTGSSTMTSVGLKPLSSAAAYTNGLNDEPGWRSAWTARLKLLSFQSRPPASARIAPVLGSIATTAPWRYGV